MGKGIALQILIHHLGAKGRAHRCLLTPTKLCLKKALGTGSRLQIVAEKAFPHYL